MKKDIISKELIKKLIVKDISKYILGIEIDEVKFLDKEFERIESKRADIVVDVKNFILHLELQSSYDSKMNYRMMRYWLDIKEITKLPVKQYLINFSNKNMKNYLEVDNVKFSFEIINIKELDCERFLETNSPDAIVLALLCDFKDNKPEVIVEKILIKLKKLLNEREFKKYFMIMEELSSLRDLKQTIKEVEMRLSDITFEDYPSYEIGMEKGFNVGITRGIEKGIEKGRLAERKKLIKMMLEFGIPFEVIAQKLDTDVDSLKKVINES